VLVALLLTVAVGACRSPSRHDVSLNGSKGQDKGVLMIRVSTPSPQQAEANCGRSNSGTGYLSSLAAAAAACITATISGPVQDFLEDGHLPTGKWCHRAPPEPSAVHGATVEIRSQSWFGKRIDRRLVVRSQCDAAMWSYLSPLLHPAEQPLIVHEAG
jgi:hypothetical protein